jgi:hypothetical protein
MVIFQFAMLIFHDHAGHREKNASCRRRRGAVPCGGRTWQLLPMTSATASNNGQQFIV